MFTVAFAAFSVAVALGWLYGPDLWVLQMAQEHRSGFLDTASGIFSLPGSTEVVGAALFVLLAALFLRGHRVLAGRLLVVFVVTELLELAMKLYLPQVPIPSNERSVDFAPLLVADLLTLTRAGTCSGALSFLGRCTFCRGVGYYAPG